MMPAFEREFSVFVGALNKDASQRIAQAARTGRAEIVDENKARRGIAPTVISAVDGDQAKRFEDVKPSGQIVLLFDYRAEIVKALFDELKARSPVSSGAYRDSHFVQLDGAGLDPLTVPTTEQIKNTTRITVTNPVHYAQRLEAGKRADGTPFVRQVAPHIFESAMKAVRSEFSGVAKFTFGTISLAGGWTRVKGDKSGRRDRSSGSTIVYPAIHIDRI
jgi:hypothetical protein